MLKDIQDAVPAKTKLQWAIQVAGVGVALVPNIGLIPGALHRLVECGMVPTSVEQVPIYVGTAMAGFYGAKAASVFKGKKEPGIWVGKMFIPENAFWTSILITGRPGSGKTSGAIMPIAEQLFRLYNGPDYIAGRDEAGNPIMEENKYARIGGTVLEVKGEFYEKIAYLMHQCQRNVYEDFLIIRPDSSIPVAQMKDPDSGNIFYVNALPCASGSEAGRLLMTSQRSLPPEQKTREDIFSCPDKEFKEKLDALRKVEYVPTKDTCYVGWRLEGGKLLRVSHTKAYNEVEYIRDVAGAVISVPPPAKLQFVDRLLLSNGLQYNLIDPSVGANEAAEKLARMASVSGRGEGKGGDNSYWFNNAQKLIAQCIALRRVVHPDLDVTCADIYRMIADKKTKVGDGKGVEKGILDHDKELLTRRLVAIKQELANVKDIDKHNEIRRRTVEPIEAIADYFTGEWGTLDDKIKSTIKTVVSNTFSNFVFDPALNETFCAKATFNFSDCMQKARVFCFVPGPQYETLAKTIGTGLKLDFQQACLQRLQRADYNKKRPILHLTDECWNWVISGGAGGGDPKFLSLCREPRIINLLATQNYDQFIAEIGRDATNNYLGQFGVFVWLQNFNSETNKMAEGLMALEKREKFKASSGNLNMLNALDAKNGGAHMEQSWEEKKMFSSQDFVTLDGDEAVVFNGYRKRSMAMKTKLPKSILTHPKEQPKIAQFMREFLRGSIEQSLWRLGKISRVDHVVNQASQVAQVAPTAPVPAKVPQTTVSGGSNNAQPNAANNQSKPVGNTPVPQSGSQSSPTGNTQPKVTKPTNGGTTPVPQQQKAPESQAPKPQATPEKSTEKKQPWQNLPPEAAKAPAKRDNGVNPDLPDILNQQKPANQSGNSSASTEDQTDEARRASDEQPPVDYSPGSVDSIPKPIRKFRFGKVTKDPNATASTDSGKTSSSDGEGMTPREIDEQSEEFRRMWQRLSTAASELVTQDDFGLANWVQGLVKKNQSGSNVGPDLLVGPSGITSGDPAIIEKAAPIPDIRLDSMSETQKQPYNSKKRISAEEQFQRKKGPAWMTPVEESEEAA